MNNKYNLSEQETFIMNILWEHNEEMTLAEIADLARESGFAPAIGTAKTYLQRLVKKEAVRTNKVGHKLLYSPVPESTYRQKWTQSILESSFNGSLQAFVCALTGNADLTAEQVQYLKDLYDE